MGGLGDDGTTRLGSAECTEPNIVLLMLRKHPDFIFPIIAVTAKLAHRSIQSAEELLGRGKSVHARIDSGNATNQKLCVITVIVKSVHDSLLAFSCGGGGSWGL